MPHRRRIAGEEKSAEAVLRARVPSKLKRRAVSAARALDLTESQLLREAVESHLNFLGIPEEPEEPRPGASD